MKQSEVAVAELVVLHVVLHEMTVAEVIAFNEMTVTELTALTTGIFPAAVTLPYLWIASFISSPQ